MDTAAGHANVQILSVENQPRHFVAGPSRRRSSQRFTSQPYDGDGLPNQKAKSLPRRPPPQIDAARLEATYTSRNSHSNIGLPIDEQECQKRVQSYSYASLYPKGSHSTRRIQETTGGNAFKAPDIHHAIWVGRKWDAILSLFDSIVQNLGKRQPSFKPHGLMFLLKAGYSWYRAKEDARRTALTNLCLKTDLVEQANSLGELVAKQVDEIKAPLSFVQSDSATLVSRPSAYVPGHWKMVAEALSSEILLDPMSEDSRLLLILVCMLDSSAFSPRLLFFGATPRKRWTEQGHIGDAACVGLASELRTLLSDISRLQGAVDELENASVLTKTCGDSYAASEATRSRVLATLLPEVKQFWRRQAFFVTCHAVPWKYLEYLSSEQWEILIPHLEYTLQATRSHGDFRAMTGAMKQDLALTLLEASRFPGRRWKLLTVACAKEATHSMDDPYVKSCIAQRESLLHRLAGSQEKAIHVMDDIWGDSSQHQLETHPRMHAAAGSATLQHAMNFFQEEKLAAAIQALDSWQPLHCTPAEGAVMFRMGVLRGRILRSQGRFDKSLACLEIHLADSDESLVFNEDLPGLICELADTLRELEEPLRAEQLLRNELARGNLEHRSSAKCLLKLCLAESLFARGRFLQSDEICSHVESQSDLGKMGRLRLFITLAKLRHVRCDWDAAFNYWTQALLTLNTFPPTSGLATRTIYLSTCDILRRQGRDELELAARVKVTTLERLCKNSEAKHWIAGLRHWLAFLDAYDI